MAISRIFLSVLLGALLPGAPAMAGEKASPLIVDGKPIDPTCLLVLTEGELTLPAQVPAHNCRHDDITIKNWSADDGMIGFEYEFKDSPDEAHQPYFQYKNVGSIQDKTILFIGDGGGGSGEFTQLVELARRGDSFVALRWIASGDRCNGGVSHPSVGGGHVVYDQDITPFDLIGLAIPPSKPSGTVTIGSRSVTLEAYKSLEASAASCFATVHNKDKDWVSVTLTQQKLEDQGGWTKQYTYQPCFNSLYRSYVAAGRIELDRSGVQRFAKDFADQCVDKS